MKFAARMSRLGNALGPLTVKMMVAEADVPKLLDYFKGMSHGQFRIASTALADSALLSDNCSEENYWKVFAGIVPTNPKAFLGTFLKAAVRRYDDGGLHITSSPELQAFAVQASPIDKRKVMDALMPKVKTSDEVNVLLRLFVAGEPKDRVNALLKVDTAVACYCLFCELRQQEGDDALIHQTALSLMRRQTKHGYNLASMVQTYFGLDPLPGTFSLRLNPYELSLLERSEEEFMKILNR